MGAYIAVRAATEAQLRPWRILLVSCPSKYEDIVTSGALIVNPIAMLFQRGTFAVPREADPYFHWGPMFLEKPSATRLAPALPCPVSFLGGRRDYLVFNNLSKAVYDAAPEPKRWTLWDDGLHAEAMALQHPADFQAWVAESLK
jgi:hypothetical protein